MTDILDLVDVDRLRTEIQSKYRDVAEDPAATFHFDTGRQHALRLGFGTYGYPIRARRPE